MKDKEKSGNDFI